MKSTTSLHSTSLLAGFALDEAIQRFHPESKEHFDEVALNEERTAVATFFADETVILRRGDVAIPLDNVEAMKLGNTIVMRSRTKESEESHE